MRAEIRSTLIKVYPSRLRYSASRLLALVSIFITVIIILLLPVFKAHKTFIDYPLDHAPAITSVQVMQDTLDYLINFPLAPTEFGRMGQLVRLLTHYLQMLDNGNSGLSPSQAHSIVERIDQAIVASFPFIQNSKSKSKSASGPECGPG